MKTIMSLNQLTSIQQFLDGTQAVVFGISTNKQERYRWIHAVLVKHHTSCPARRTKMSSLAI